MKRARTTITGHRPDVRGRPIGEDVAKELAFHLDMRTEELIEAGWDPAAAREEAERMFGDVKRVNRECTAITESHDRARYRARRVEAVWQDLRYAARSLLGSPGFSVIAILTLGLGIGANSAIFSLVNGVLLQPLPYPDSDRLVRVFEVGDRGQLINVPWVNFVDWRDQARSFDGLAAYAGGVTTILGGDRPARGRATQVSEDFFRVFELAPVVGRTTLAEEHREGADPAVVISHDFWRSEMGADVDLSGRRVEVYGFRARVVGVMPSGFSFPADTDVWLPAELFPQTPSRTAHNYRVVGRVVDGVGLPLAREDMNRVTAALASAYAGEIDAVAARIDTLQEDIAGDVRRPLVLLLGAAGLVLLVACSNLASTLLARGMNRQREMAIRGSLGADRSRIVRQLFTESLLLSFLGALAGLGLAALVIRTLSVMGPAGLPRLQEVGLDTWVVLFTLAVSVLTAVLFGLIPAMRGSAGDIAAALRAGSGGSGRRSTRAWKLLVGGEVALAMVLLVGSGLLIRSFWTVLAVDPGFDPEGVLTVSVNLPATQYGADAQMVAYYDQLVARTGQLAGVVESGLISALPLSGATANGLIEVEGKEEPGSGHYRIASAGYFRAMGIPLIRGRLFEERDDATVPDVVLVNETFAERTWPGEDPLGKRISGGGLDMYVDTLRGLHSSGFPYNRLATVVGVVGDVRHANLTRDPWPEFFFHYKQRPSRARGAVAVLKTTGDPNAGVAPTRALLRELDDQVPTAFATMDRRVGRSVADRRFTMALLAAFAAIALLLAAVGIYGVVSYRVARRTREIGIRVALGAESFRIKRTVLGDAMGMVFVGVVLGLAGAAAVSRLLQNLLYEVSSIDVPTFLAVAALLVVVAVAAAWIPVRRTTRIDPMITMRSD